MVDALSVKEASFSSGVALPKVHQAQETEP